MNSNLVFLSAAVSKNCSDRGEKIISDLEIASGDLLHWLQFIRGSQLTGYGDGLIAGTMSALCEGASCLCLGLARPALNSLRLQIDLVLAWLYFKDHPVEWDRVAKNGDGYKLKSEIFKYLTDCIDGFGQRFSILKDCMTRKVEDPYRLLSAHIHGQSELVLPAVTKPQDIVSTPLTQDEVVVLQHACSEYMSDVFWSVYSKKWAALPGHQKNKILTRFKTAGQREAFFK